MRKRKRKAQGKTQANKGLNKAKIIGYVLIALMIFSVGAIVLSNPDAQNSYNGFNPVRKFDGWELKLDGEQVFFLNHPLNVETFTVPEQLIIQLKEEPQMGFTFSVEGMSEGYLKAVDYTRLFLDLDIAKNNVVLINGIEGETEQYNLPQLSCENATQYLSVIRLSVGNTTEIVQEGDCYQITASSPQGMLNLIDSLRYRIYGVIE